MKTGKILDPIHGTIGITEIEKYIINQSIFARLRKVKQNTLLNLVFPGANHTRFEHSIGVMHISEQIFNRSNENFKISCAKNEKYGIKNKLYISISDLIEKDSDTNIDTIVQELRLAALLHDVGHGPTSHKFDHFTISGEELLNILKGEEIFNKYLNYFDAFLTKEGKDKKIEHELVSIVFLIELLENLKIEQRFSKFSLEVIKKIKIENIIKMIDPEFLPDHKIKINSIDCSDYFNSIISSFPIDADRMDYMLRDTFYTGVSYGLYDADRILMSVVPVKFIDIVEKEGDSKEIEKITLGIKKSGLESIIRFVQSRNHLYNQIYFHKTNASTNAMLDFIFRNLDKQHKSVIEASNYTAYKNFYIKNSDEFFLENTLKNCLDKDECDVNGKGCPESDVLDELLQRKLFKRIYEQEDKYFELSGNIKNPRSDQEIKDFVKREKFNKDKFEAVKLELEQDNIYIQEHSCDNLGLKGHLKSKIVIVGKDEGNAPEIFKNWDEIDAEFIRMNDSNVMTKRIYMRSTFTKAEEYKAMRKIALDKLEKADLI
ncbi:HD domain-containing protein [Empedobacter tilapiae]|uniref:HD domain-containing protein n=1 Tax=Empedobacter tilapiae TaxID=2491114 RepID=UPI0028D020CB|nr:HD domain-containing protein [Empedobacter tilapiae]